MSNDNAYSHETFIADWAFLASRYAKTSVIGADLWNEPKDSVTWGGGNLATDWAAAATAAGNAILSSNRDWLVIVEGTGTNTWWGGNQPHGRGHQSDRLVGESSFHSVILL